MAPAGKGRPPHRDRFGKVGAGHAIGHHGELVQGVFEDDQGRLHRGLITVPLDGLCSTASLTLKKAGPLLVDPPDRTKALRAANLTLEQLGRCGAGGVLHIRSHIPIGHGYGSSTADVIAAIRAAADTAAVKLPPSSISRLAVAAEIAADATAFEAEAVLFAHREGEIIEHFGGSLPPFILVGFKAAAVETVDTLQLTPARYDAEEIQTFRVLRGMVARAVRDQDLRLLGRAATISATISQRHLPKPHFDIVTGLAERHDAAGMQVAHSGTLYGLMLDPNSPRHETSERIRHIAAELVAAGFMDISIYSVSGAGDTDDI